MTDSAAAGLSVAGGGFIAILAKVLRQVLRRASWEPRNGGLFYSAFLLYILVLGMVSASALVFVCPIFVGLQWLVRRLVWIC